MLLQPRTYQTLQRPDRTPGPSSRTPSVTAAASAHTASSSTASASTSTSSTTARSPHESPYSFFAQPLRPLLAQRRHREARRMLLVHQAGSVKVGEVVRYTLTYTPSRDRVLPTPGALHLKIRNTSANVLRAAWVHGPYTLHVSAYPSTFNPHRRVDDVEREAGSVPEYEPMVKAGGTWTTKLVVPEAIRETGKDLGRSPRMTTGDGEGEDEEERESVTWIIDVASQILFSNSASVHFEVLVGRDAQSLELGFAAVAGSRRQGGPAQIKDSQTEEGRKAARERDHVQTEGVYSKAVRLVVEDTETLWDKPALPTWEDLRKRGAEEGKDAGTRPKRKRIHLVVVTHGLHSNTGADLLFLKESIDATVKQARVDAKKRKQAYRESNGESAKAATNGDDKGMEAAGKDQQDISTAPLSGGQEDLDNSGYDSDDEEETIVRGFSGNAVRTENGIQYLGKRLAKWILRATYPDQPFLPVKKKFTRTLTDTFRSDADKAKRDGRPAHQGSSIHHGREQDEDERPYKFTSISFVGHSLGGLIQMYAIGYIQKHSPTFFDLIEPINFVALAAPMLGLSNENPMYVKFALDFGLVGRTGQDLGLTWRPPGLTKNSWNTMIAGLGAGHKDKDPQQPDPGSKPLLRILPKGPAHRVLRKFRNRTLYSNVVNDGIVPLRTSCLLFLDWRGLGKVEKARRENGLLGMVAEWGWAELTGVNASLIPPNVRAEQYNDSDDEDDEHVRKGEGETVPLPAEDETAEDNKRSTTRASYEEDEPDHRKGRSSSFSKHESNGEKGVLDGFLDLFRAKSVDKGPVTPSQSKKTTKALRRGQTIHHGFDELPEEVARGQEGTMPTNPTTPNPTIRPHMPHMHTGQTKSRPGTSRDQSFVGKVEEVMAPPTTSIFESAGDILHPPLPSKQWITDPSTRKRTIFHDRVYHPEDIPPPPARRTGSIFTKLTSPSSSTLSSPAPVAPPQSPSLSSSSSPHPSASGSPNPSAAGSSGMKVEEKIARDYHADLSWRKVLVRLEPDAHNNMIVRRMFANAYGWPVIKHLCDTHFADTYSARTRDDEEPTRERARPLDAPIDPARGEEVEGQTAAPDPAREDLGRDEGERTPSPPVRSGSEVREMRDELMDLERSREGAMGSYSSAGKGHGSGANVGSALKRLDSAEYDDGFFEDGSDGEDSDAVDERGFVQRMLNPHPRSKEKKEEKEGGAKGKEGLVVDAHRGLMPVRGREARDGEDGNGARTLVEEPEGLVASPTSYVGSVADVGLRRSMEEVVAGSRSKAKEASHK